ncbi:AT-hook motif nuclear-localized protein 10-like protein [Cinnamomum micranthum f. kanehirae]|uniref:AT-hook motif nuclear-localized protein n=1 Tax=Cinnamomum micranthum f. kanehirae TaxID=337451 RepID=A0A443NVW8_9MAGN|nr:AT-hook motif nuclear-localized protein 10-like protein [Cinnamomum micranthum f. kanehirae]
MDPSSGLMRLAESEGGNTVFRPVVLSSTPAPAPAAAAAPQRTATATAAAYTATAVSSGESSRRKRGRPRKYGPDGSMVLAVMPVSPPVMLPSPAVVLPGGPAVATAAAIPPLSSGVPVSPAVGSPSSGRTRVSTAVLPPSSGRMPVLPAVVAPLSGNGGFPSVVLTTKRGRGRPVGSGNKRQAAVTDLGSRVVGLKPHILTVKTGEDVSGKIMSFPEHGLKGMCILSANGSISNVTLRQSSTSGGTVTYEIPRFQSIDMMSVQGRFEILTLSGSYLLSESGGQRSRTGGLSVSLAGSDGRILGGGVAGLLIAASPIQVVIGSFDLVGEDKLKLTDPFAPLKISLVGAPASPPSRGTLNESSGSPPNQNTGNYSNSPHQGMVHMLWK